MDVILIDGKNLAFRAYWTRSFMYCRDMPTSVLSGFPEILCSISRKWPRAPIVVVWDGGGKTWRHKLMAERSKRLREGAAPIDKQASAARQERDKNREYKGTRNHNTDHYKLVHDQLPLLKTFLKSIGIWNFEVSGLEADDLIGLLSHYLPKIEDINRVVIYSRDRDYFQLISDKVLVWHPEKGEKRPSVVTPESVRKQFGIYVADWVKYRALVGDHCDNIPSVKFRIGPVTARKLLEMGLDASQEEYKLLSAHAKMNPKIQEFREGWREVHDNYRLTKIVKRVGESCLDDETRKHVNKILEVCENTKLRRNGKYVNDVAYKAMTEFMAKYELSELFAMRQTLWNLP